MRKLLTIILSFSLMFIITGCSLTKEIVDNNSPREDIQTVEYSGSITNMILTLDGFKITLDIQGEEKTFLVPSTKYLIDNSYNPRVEPYLDEGVYVKFECTEDESKKDIPTVKTVIIESYDGVFVI